MKKIACILSLVVAVSLTACATHHPDYWDEESATLDLGIPDYIEVTYFFVDGSGQISEQRITTPNGDQAAIFDTWMVLNKLEGLALVSRQFEDNSETICDELVCQRILGDWAHVTLVVTGDVVLFSAIAQDTLLFQSLAQTFTQHLPDWATLAWEFEGESPVADRIPDSFNLIKSVASIH